MPYLLAACDIYAAPSRLEGFGMLQVEANACGKPVIGINAMGLLDTMVHGETAFLAGVAQEIRLHETVVGGESGARPGHRVVFKNPRIVDYRASVDDIAKYLMDLMQDAELRRKMGRPAENASSRTTTIVSWPSSLPRRSPRNSESRELRLNRTVFRRIIEWCRAGWTTIGQERMQMTVTDVGKAKECT